MSEQDAPAPVDLVVCVRCRRGRQIPEGQPRPGEQLFQALQDAEKPAGVRIVASPCMSNCADGCNIALRGAGRWTYVFSHVDEVAHVATLIAGAAAYQAAADGVIPREQRPEHFRQNCVVRIPPKELEDD